MATKFDKALIERLVRYAKVDTQSDENSNTGPSTEIQKDLGILLTKELTDLGLEAKMDEYGYVYGRLKGKLDVPAIGFVAHLDTAPGVLAENVKPRVLENYSGGNIELEDNVVIPESDLSDFVGDTIITTDGKTLLGADDKAGISAIMTAVEELMKEWNGKHGDVYVMFNPDEEIGKGTQNFNPEKFPVKAAYTLDGVGAGEIESETFYAAKASVTFIGKPTHPGQDGYQKLLNPITLASNFEAAIPATERPETTKDRFGFYYPYTVSGNPEKAQMDLLVRDFDKDGLDSKVAFLESLVKSMNSAHGEGSVLIDIEDQYPNMKAMLDKHPEVLQIATNALKEAGVTEPNYPPIRGGTDGAMLSVKFEIPTPNISTGMHNIHSVKEFASIKEMAIATNFVLNVVKAYAGRGDS
ncbi:MAG: peptidase T [Bacteroidota bacterium]